MGHVRSSARGANSNGSTGSGNPDAFPNCTSVPRGLRTASDPRNVSAPTESKTAATPLPAVNASASATKSFRPWNENLAYPARCCVIQNGVTGSELEPLFEQIAGGTPL